MENYPVDQRKTILESLYNFLSPLPPWTDNTTLDQDLGGACSELKYKFHAK